ncbi:MAG: histone acetyltransferase, partial [Pseudomonadota bacterium]
MEILLSRGPLTATDEAIVADGFSQHSRNTLAPDYEKHAFHWRAVEDQNSLVGVLTCEVLWDWIYVDQLWVAE